MATILIVDDEAPILDFLTELVSGAGHTVLGAMNGSDALLLAQQYHPELIISDVMMPVMDGFAFVKALRSDPTLVQTNVMLVSAASFPIQSFIGTATSFASKPLDLNLIESMLP
jgi:CheY-like chemotaxis protein